MDISISYCKSVHIISESLITVLRSLDATISANYIQFKILTVTYVRHLFYVSLPIGAL